MRAVQGGRLWRVGLTLAAVAVMVAQIGGCSGETVAGTPSPMGDIDTTDAGGVPATDGPSGPRDGVEAAPLEVENTDGGEIDRVATDAVADLYDFWHEQLPKHFNEEFEELQRLLSYDSTKDKIEICGTTTFELVNAFYCGGAGEDVIAWDRGVLLPELAKDFTEMSVVGVLAHEMGHAVQFRLGDKSNMSQSTPTIVREQQADCYMGNFMRYVVDGESKHFELNTGDGLNAILATLFFIRDPAGFDHRTEGAHGLAFDRVYAFQEGFRNDPKRCAKMDPEEIDDRIAEKERTEKDEDVEGQVDVTDEEIQQLLEKSLNEAFQDNGAEQPEIRYDGAKCDDGKATSPVAYCPDENVVAVDLEKLSKIATPLAEGEQPGEEGAGIGDFAAFAEIVSRYTLSIQKSVGARLDDEEASLRTACLTGAWAGYSDQEPTDGEGKKLRLAVGDLDEAVAELLQENSLVAADVNGKQVKSGFARVEAFRRGYMEGSGRCTESLG